MEEMEQHRTKHLTENKFKCEICSKEFPSHSSMWKHTKAHTGERKYEVGRYFNGSSRNVKKTKIPLTNDSKLMIFFFLLPIAQVLSFVRFVTKALPNWPTCNDMISSTMVSDLVGIEDSVHSQLLNVFSTLVYDDNLSQHFHTTLWWSGLVHSEALMYWNCWWLLNVAANVLSTH